ncbi:MAG: TraR/DksA family transcriptional regulator [candidate division Zixibacteria bacterium]|nr:TraR/DksA family transcriptional regulator [candidate division Zixibacteria bacterium]MDD5427133.1 TraR/DksA family transcriptional regulator [candidate division Zixibacteria bacterium]
MKKTDLKKFEALLLKKKAELLKEMGIILDARTSKPIKEAHGDLSSHSYHMADQGTDNMEQEMAFIYASKSGRLIYHIDEALRRIEKGTYGKCTVCGKAISSARLEAVPHARMCIECKSAEEEKKAGR